MWTRMVMKAWRSSSCIAKGDPQLEIARTVESIMTEQPRCLGCTPS